MLLEVLQPETGLDAGLEHRPVRDAIHVRGQRNAFAGPPAVLPEEVRHAADRIGRVGAQVDKPVAVEIHGELQVASGHELRDADRPRIGAAHGEYVDPGLAREQQVIFQLAAEEFGARRIIERQRGERIDDAPPPDVAAVEGLDADDRNDHLFGNSVFAAGARERRAVHAPEIKPRLDAAVVDERRAVRRPRACALGGRRRDPLQRGGKAPGAREREDEFALDEAVAPHHLLHEGAYLGPAAVGRRRRVRSEGRAAEEQCAKTCAQPHASLSVRTNRFNSAISSARAAGPYRSAMYNSPMRRMAAPAAGACRAARSA